MARPEREARSAVRQRQGRNAEPWLRALALGLFALFPTALWLASAALETTIQTASLPDNLLDDLNGTPIFFDRNGEVIAQLATDEARVHIPVPLGAMGEHLPAVTVALEDHRFERHRGVDLYAICAAAYRSATTPGHLSGASTVSQQAIKLADKRKGRRLRSKLRESVLALKLERQWSKDEILEAYINRLDYGNRRIGVEAAAWAYFGKPATGLTLAESVFLAGLPQAPTTFNPWLRPREAFEKYRRSLTRLERLGFLTIDQAERLSSSPPSVRRDLPPNIAPAFVDAFQRSETTPPAIQGAHIATTLDGELQQEAEAILAAQLASLNRHEIRNAAMVVIENSSGAVRALVSASLDPASRQSAFNAALVPRHAGSTLKPFIYLQAIDRRALTAATLLADTPDATADIFPGYEPQNYNREFAGPVRVRDALARSLNITAVLALHAAGPREAFQSLTAWGLHTDARLEELGAGFALGNRKVRLLDLASAYAGIARGGVAMPPSFLSTAPPEPGERLASRQACAIVADILADDGARAPSFGRRSVLYLEGHRCAVKTGTSSSHRDAWTAGFDQDHTVAVWFGNLDGRSMGDSLTIESAAPAWHRMVRYLVNSRGSRQLPAPGGRRMTVDMLTGASPCESTRSTREELFLPGTSPDPDGERFYTAGGDLQLPMEFAVWVDSPHNHLGAVLARSENAPLTILSPSDGAVYRIDPDIPPTQQQIKLRADTEGAAWRVNGDALKSPYFRLSPGVHTVTATTPKGRATATITVE